MAVTMSQKSSLVQFPKSVSQVLTGDNVLPRTGRHERPVSGKRFPQGDLSSSLHLHNRELDHRLRSATVLDHGAMSRTQRSFDW